MATTDCTLNSAHSDRMQTDPFAFVHRMFAVWRSRRALARLDIARLDDIGVTSWRAAAEAAKPIWDVPAAWRC